MSDADVMTRLAAVIESRKGGDPDKSYVAKLFKKGRHKIAQKVGEEFHLLVLWADVGLKPEDVFAELARREGVSGVDEKKSRKS